jgi:hypothetical protein
MATERGALSCVAISARVRLYPAKAPGTRDKAISYYRRRYALPVIAKEKPPRDVLDLDEAEAAHARMVVTDEPEMAHLPEGRGETLTGAPNVAAAAQRSRETTDSRAMTVAASD